MSPRDVTICAPHLFGDEIQLMRKVFSSGYKRYLEFGLGGSTLMAIHHFETVVAVDSDLQWVDAVKGHPDFANAIASGQSTILHADIGPTGDWGTPIDESCIKRWPSYIAAPWREWARRKCLPDLVYVDGRFRVACCYSVVVSCLLHVHKHFPKLLIHDFSHKRPYYMDILKYFDVEECENTLFLLKIKEEIPIGDIFEDLLFRQFDMR